MSCLTGAPLLQGVLRMTQALVDVPIKQSNRKVS
jgi:hypothetical protein